MHGICALSDVSATFFDLANSANLPVSTTAPALQYDWASIGVGIAFVALIPAVIAAHYARRAYRISLAQLRRLDEARRPGLIVEGRRIDESTWSVSVRHATHAPPPIWVLTLAVVVEPKRAWSIECSGAGPGHAWGTEMPVAWELPPNETLADSLEYRIQAQTGTLPAPRIRLQLCRGDGEQWVFEHKFYEHLVVLGSKRPLLGRRTQLTGSI